MTHRPEDPGPITPALRSGRSRARQEWWLLGSVLVAVGLFGLWSRHNEYRNIDTEQRSLLAAQALAIDENLSRQLVAADAALRAVREDLAAWPADEIGPRASRRFKALSEAMPGIRTMALLDRDGRVLGASRFDLTGMDLSDREYFRLVREQPDPKRLALSPPVMTELSQYTMNLAIAVPTPDGRFGGVIAATLDPDYFRAALRATLYAPDVWAGVAHGDGQLVMLEPPRSEVVGKNLDEPGSMFRLHRQSGRSESLMTGHVIATGEERMLAQRTVQPASLAMDKPLVVAVSRRLDAIFEHWWDHSTVEALLYGLLVATTTLTLRSIQRRQRDVARLQAQQEAAARGAAERLELALRGADLGFWDLDVPRDITHVSERWNSMLGLAHQATYPDSTCWSSRVHPDDAARVIGAHAEHLAGRSERFEASYRMRHADGRWIWIFDRAQVLERDAQGAPLRMVGTHMDITDAMEARLALERNEQRLRSLLENLDTGVVVHGPDTQVLEANPAACRLLGLGIDALRGKTSTDPCWRFLREDGSPMAPAEYPVNRVLVQRGSLHDQTLGIRRPGPPEPLWVSCNAFSLRDAEGALQQIVVTITDITERKHAAQRILAAQSELEATLDAIPDLLFDVALDGTYHGFHSPRRDLLYATPGSFIGRTVREVLPHEAAEVVMQALRQAETAGFSAGLQYELSLPQGSYWFELSLARKPVPRGDVPRFIGLARDITERKQSEIERHALERQLREAQKMESIGTLAGGIAHDFNNILAAILGNVALARADVPAGHPVVTSLDQINRAGLRARQLVQQILTFSRSDRLGLTTKSLAPLVEEAVELMRATLPASVQLDVVVPAHEVLVRGESTQLHQVLVNLCTNAWHALPERGGRIEVGFERLSFDEAARRRWPELAPDVGAHVWVKDNGSGMDEETRQRVFDPFFTTKPIGQGTGLGLSVVHGIVQAHQGSISIDTAPGHGTTVHLFLAAPVAGQAEAAPSLPLQAPPRGGGHSVLYIDDDEIMRVMVERLLSRAGFRVNTATDAADALAQIDAQPDRFDAIVTDFNMPRMNGLDLAEQVALVRPHMPVVISSGFLSDELRRQAREVGVTALMKKENTLEELVGLLQSLLAPG